MNKSKLQEQIDKFVTPKPPEPKHDMVDCTDRPDIIAACDTTGMTDRQAIKAPIGGWYGDRFWVYKRSLKQWRGEKVETTA